MTQIQRVGLACLAICIVHGIPELLNAAPTCALVDSTKSPMTALLEARLLSRDDATWVERSQIDRILAEAELQTAFGAEGVAARSKLGQALKADLLVLLRSAKNPNPQGPALIECVVCETRAGLRLRTITIALEKEPEAAVRSLEEAIVQGLKKYSEKLEAIVAVPPFLSDDLGRESNYLQSAYAKLVEERLLVQPGLLVVELGEAQAIAKELALAGETSTTRFTKTPLHVVGRYRHDIVGNTKTMRLSLRLMKSETQLTLKGIKDLPPNEVPTWILKKTDELLPLLNLPDAGRSEDFSADKEAKVLAARARQFLKVGNWQEALSLFEASLLLRPDDSDVLRDSLIATTNIIPKLTAHIPSLEDVQRVIDVCDRGYELLERHLRMAPNLKIREQASDPEIVELNLEAYISNYVTDRDLSHDAPMAAEIDAALERARTRRTQTLLRIAYARAKAGFTDLRDHNAWDSRAVTYLPDKERFAAVLRVAEEWKDLPDLVPRLVRMTFNARAWMDDSPEFRELLRQLDASPRPILRAAGMTMLRRFEAGQQRKLEFEKKQDPQVAAELDPRLEKVALTIATDAWLTPTGSLTAFAGADLFYRNARLSAMRKPGLVQDLYQYHELNLHMAAVAYDGRYVWVAGRFPVVLLAVDDQGKAVQFTNEDGLPRLEERSELRLAPVAPGKICVIGNTGRSWAANVELAPSGGKKCEVFFEAREAVTTTEDSHKTNPHVVFTPTSVFALRSADKPGCLIYCGRRSVSSVISERPLLIDPIAKTARVAPFTCPAWDYGNERLVTQSSDTLYFYEYDPSAPTTPNLMRIRFPGGEKEKFVERCPEGWLALDQRGLHLIGKKWSVADLSTGKVTTLVESMPWFYLAAYGGTGIQGIDLATTNHLKYVFATTAYGPLVQTQKGQEVLYYRLK
jgi:hypothetical protein